MCHLFIIVIKLRFFHFDDYLTPFFYTHQYLQVYPKLQSTSLLNTNNYVLTCGRQGWPGIFGWHCIPSSMNKHLHAINILKRVSSVCGRKYSQGIAVMKPLACSRSTDFLAYSLSWYQCAMGQQYRPLNSYIHTRVCCPRAFTVIH